MLGQKNPAAFLARIILPSGSCAAAPHLSEYELILPRNTKLKVTKVDQRMTSDEVELAIRKSNFRGNYRKKVLAEYKQGGGAYQIEMKAETAC